MVKRLSEPPAEHQRELHDAGFVDLGSPREQFPRDGRASAAAVQALLKVSSLIRNLPGRSRSRAEQYINHAYLEMAGK